MITRSSGCPAPSTAPVLPGGFGRLHPAGLRRGYVFLLAVLSVGAIAAAAAATLLLLGGAAEHTASSLEDSVQALEYAQSCVEEGILLLRTDRALGGEQTLQKERGYCRLAFLGMGYANRTLCAEGSVGRAVRRVRVDVKQVFPTVRIADWRKDVPCPF